jgi:hypothetical protein
MVNVPTDARDHRVPTAPTPPAAARWPFWLGGVGLWLAVFGAKARLIAKFGTDLPFWDEWAKQGQMIIAPFYKGALHFGDFLIPHSEHRIAPTLLLNLALVVVGGQWDARVACLVNAGLHALIIVGVVIWVARAVSLRWGVALAWISLGLYLLPLDWENTLTGFQSQFYFLIGFSLVAIGGLLHSRGPGAAAWWIGLGSAVLAGVSMGSGFVCAAPVFLVITVRLLTSPQRRARDLATWVAALAILGAGWFWRPRAPWDAPMQAQNAAQFISYALRCLAWPQTAWSWCGVVVWLPWLGLMFPPQRPRWAAASARIEILFAIGIWVGIQDAAIAFGRGGGAGDPAWRYADVFAIGVLCNALSFSAYPRFRRGAFALWLAAVFGAALAASWPLWQGELPAYASRARVYEHNVREYLATGDPQALEGEVPFPDRAWLRRILDDPAIRAVLPPSVGRPSAPGQPARTSRFSRVGRRVAEWGGALGAAGGVFLLLATVALERGKLRPAAPATRERRRSPFFSDPLALPKNASRSPRTPLRLMGLALGLGCVVLGARWVVIEKFGTDLPMMDEWDAQGLDELAPWFGGTFGPQNLFHPQNEHRVVLTKTLNLAVALANRQWDQRLEMVLNAVFPAAIAGLFLIYAGRHLPSRWQLPLFFLLAAVYGLPVAWENITRGFDSAQFFLIGFSSGAILLLPFASIRQGRWWLGAACLVFALGSLASGCFAGVIVAALLTLRVIRREIRWATAAPGLVLSALAVSMGLGTRVVVAVNASLGAHSGADFAATAVRALGWPAFDQGFGGVSLLLWLPWTVLVVRLLARGRGRFTAAEYGVLGLGSWVGLQILATAFARGAGGPAPASRYIDNLVVGIFANGLAAALCWEAAPRGRRWRLGLIGAVWGFLLVAGIGPQVRLAWRQELPAAALNDYYAVQNTRNFLATGDLAYLQHHEIPYPGPRNFYDRIEIPALRALMPASVRPPLALEPQITAGGFWRLDTRTPEGQAAGPREEKGISPGTPPLTNAVVWGSYGRDGDPAGAAWSSRPLRRTIPGWLRFEIAGDLGRPGTALEIRDAQTGAVIETVRPERTPGEGWHAADVRAPAAAFVVAARVTAPGRWFAFAPPVEMGRLSYFAARAEKQGRLLMAFGCGLALAMFAGGFARTDT